MSQKTSTFYFFNNEVKNQSTRIIFGTKNLAEISRKRLPVHYTRKTSLLYLAKCRTRASDQSCCSLEKWMARKQFQTNNIAGIVQLGHLLC